MASKASVISLTGYTPARLRPVDVHLLPFGTDYAGQAAVDSFFHSACTSQDAAGAQAARATCHGSGSTAAAAPAAATATTASPAKSPRKAKAAAAAAEDAPSTSSTNGASTATGGSGGDAVDGTPMERRFRGRLLRGRRIPLPPGFCGVVFREQRTKVTDQHDREWSATGRFGDLCYYNLETPPSEDDALHKAFAWTQIAEALHGDRASNRKRAAPDDDGDDADEKKSKGSSASAAGSRSSSPAKRAARSPSKSSPRKSPRK